MFILNFCEIPLVLLSNEKRSSLNLLTKFLGYKQTVESVNNSDELVAQFKNVYNFLQLFYQLVNHIKYLHLGPTSEISGPMLCQFGNGKAKKGHVIM